MTIDPDNKKLRAALKNLQAGVESGAFTPEVANAMLGKIADGLVEISRGKNWRQDVADAWNHGDLKYRREVLGQ
jgi:hypothetical protein